MKRFFPVIVLASLVFFIIPQLLLQSCARTRKQGRFFYRGEIPSGQEVARWKMYIPKDMVVVPGGSFILGPSTESIFGEEALNKRISLSSFCMDDAPVTNAKYRFFIENLEKQAESALEEEAKLKEENEEALLEEEKENIIPVNKQNKLPNYSLEYIEKHFYPDEKVWEKDYSHHMGDPMMGQYFKHVSYNSYPVVGITRFAAKAYTRIRTHWINEMLREAGKPPIPALRLPTAAEYTYAARGGKPLAKYPWGGPYIRDYKGNLLANFKSKHGNYGECGFTYTSPIGAFAPNEYGLFDMAGNIAEWCEDAYSETALQDIPDINPVYKSETEPKKVVMGGSWKDISHYLKTGVMDYENEHVARSYIGFRCVMPYFNTLEGYA